MSRPGEAEFSFHKGSNRNAGFLARERAAAMDAACRAR